MSKENKKRGFIAWIIVGVILLGIIIFSLWFLNRKFYVAFDLNNGTDLKVVQVKFNKAINVNDIKGKDDLGESFVNWYKVIGIKDGEEILAEKPFDFNTKINKNIKLKAVYDSNNVTTITIKFDSNGGSKVNDVTINKGAALKLPNNPTKSGYKFVAWVDKNGTPIYNNALLNENTTLYAKWEKVESKVEQPKKVVYYCDNGYKLEGTKCTKEEKIDAKYRCPQGYYGSSTEPDYCVTYVDPEYESYCSETGAVLDEAAGKCYYGKYTNQELYCTSHGHKYYNGWCYQFRSESKTRPVCEAGKLEGAECKLTLAKTYYCEDGYKLTGKSCIKTIVINAKKK